MADNTTSEVNQSGMNRLYGGGHPAVKFTDSWQPYYDSSAEPEATARQGTQSEALIMGSHLEEAKARMTDLPLMHRVLNSGDDLISAAPKYGEDPDQE